MGGNNTINQAGIYGTKGTPSPLNTPGARAALYTVDKNGNFLLFGNSGYGNNASTSGTLNDIWIYQPAVPNVLPVTFSSFRGTSENCNIYLTWETKTEENSSYYVVEISSDGNSFRPVAKIAGRNSPIGASYGYTYKYPSNGDTYFRLEAVDRDNSFSYSPITVVKNNGVCNPGPSLRLSPNPTRNLVTLQGAGIGSLITLFDMTGKKLSELAVSNTSPTFDLAGYPAGVYVFRVMSVDGSMDNLKIVKE